MAIRPYTSHSAVHTQTQTESEAFKKHILRPMRRTREVLKAAPAWGVAHVRRQHLVAEALSVEAPGAVPAGGEVPGPGAPRVDPPAVVVPVAADQPRVSPEHPPRVAQQVRLVPKDVPDVLDEGAAVVVGGVLLWSPEEAKHPVLHDEPERLRVPVVYLWKQQQSPWLPVTLWRS